MPDGHRGQRRYRSDQARRHRDSRVAIRLLTSITSRAWSTPLDPLLRSRRGEHARSSTPAGHGGRHEFPEVASAPPELRRAIEQNGHPKSCRRRDGADGAIAALPQARPAVRRWMQKFCAPGCNRGGGPI
jgi:hypothetical protein